MKTIKFEEERSDTLKNNKFKLGKGSLDWLKCARIACFDGYQPPLYPDRNYNAREIINIAKEINANVIRVSMMGKLAHFNTDQWESDDYFKSNDFLQEIINLAHPHNIKVVPYIPGAHNLPFDLLMKWHPEWIQRSYPNQPLNETLTKPHSGTTTGYICPVGPYEDFYEGMVRKLVIEHNVDGWYTDGWKDCYFEKICYCESCREKFKKDTGNDLYSSEFTPDGNRQQEAINWYYNKIVQMVQGIHAMVWKEKRIPTIINHITGILGDQSQGAWGKDIDPIHDVMHFERKTDPYDRLVSCSYINMLGGKTWVYAGLYSPLQFMGPESAEENYEDERVFPYRKELYNESFITFACGHSVNLIRTSAFASDINSPGKQMIKEIFGLVKNNPDIFIDAQYYPFIGVLNQEVERWNYKGPLLKKIVDEGVQASIFQLKDLNNTSFLEKFSVLVSEDMAEEEQEKIFRYVKYGGRWVTSGNVSEVKKPNIIKLYEKDRFKVFMHGRGLIVQIEQNCPGKDLLEAILIANDGYLPYKVNILEGKLIPILTTKPDKWILHLINISKHFKETFDQGLEFIPEITNVGIEVNIPDNTSINNVYRILNKKPIEYSVKSNTLFLNLQELKEYDAIIIELKKE